MSGHRPHQSRSTGCVFISENKIPLQCNGVRRTRKVDGIIEKRVYSCTFVDFLCHAALKAMSEDSPVNTTGQVCVDQPVLKAALKKISIHVNDVRFIKSCLYLLSF